MNGPLPWERLLWSGHPWRLAPWIAGERYLLTDFRVLRVTRTGFEEIALDDVCDIRRWALHVQGRSNYNKATCALANKLARICYATLCDLAPFDEAARLTKNKAC